MNKEIKIADKQTLDMIKSTSEDIQKSILKNKYNIDSVIEEISSIETKINSQNSTLNSLKQTLSNKLDYYRFFQIKDSLAKGIIPSYNIGDCFTLPLLDGQTMVMQLAGIDTYYNTDELPNGVHHMDFISKNFLNNTYQMNPGQSRDDITYDIVGNNLHNILNNNILKKIPKSLISIIEDRKTYLLKTDYSNSTGGFHLMNMGKLWLPSTYEVLGIKAYHDNPLEKRYELFSKYGVPIASNWWWTRNTDGTIWAYAIHPQGNQKTNLYTTDSKLVKVCFRITSN